MYERFFLLMCLLSVTASQRLTETGYGNRNTGGYGLLRPGYGGSSGYSGSSGYPGYGGYAGSGYQGQGGYAGLGGYNPGYGGYNTGYSGYNTGSNGYNTGSNGYNTGYNGYNTGYSGYPGYTGISGGYRPNYKPGYDYNRPGYQGSSTYPGLNRPGYQSSGYERPYSTYSGNYFGGFADGYDNIRIGRKAEGKQDN